MVPMTGMPTVTGVTRVLGMAAVTGVTGVAVRPRTHVTRTVGHVMIVYCLAVWVHNGKVYPPTVSGKGVHTFPRTPLHVETNRPDPLTSNT